MTVKIRGIVAAGDRRTAAAGQQILEAGGNAFDAAVAAVLMACVVEPTLTSLGGGGFLLARTASGRNQLFDFFTQTPQQPRSAADLEFYPVAVDFGDTEQWFHVGRGTIAVPGNVAGLWQVHAQLGRVPLAVVAQPAIASAKRGEPLSEFQEFCFQQLLQPILLATPESRRLFAPQGQLPTADEVLALPELAATLEWLVQAGAREFYEGAIAQQLAADCQAGGGHLTLADLRDYRVQVRAPLMTTYRGRQLLTNPPPSSGGALIAFALELLTELELEALAFGSAPQRQALAQVMALTNAARAAGYDQQLYQPNCASQFLAATRLQPYRQQLRGSVNQWGSTTHISVLDAEGNAASVTTSNGEGSGYVIPGTGVMVNNMLGEADLNPLGFHRWPRQQRLSSMMSPTLILRDGQVEFVLGSGGSNRIRTAILQVVANLLVYEQSLQAAVAQPRVHWEAGVLNIEPPYAAGLAADLVLPAETELLLWQQQSMFFGGVHAVGRDRAGAFHGAGDPRRGGAVAVARA
ncbi:MAG: gamma-glutamyltransferase [Spirulinaceae cyanobacterium SM2_1_0]|nr:gamma-glutamyltransferase [Spirulinaceae cyanobacterium SM2_1_0]